MQRLYAFHDCSGFTGGLTLPEHLTDLGNSVFRRCGFTGELTLPESLARIGDFAFSGCSGFTGGLTLPDTLTRIGDSAFSGCRGFTGGLTLPDSLTQIGRVAFYDCSGLDFAHLGKNLQNLGHEAFSPGLPLFTDSPRVQLLINEYLNHDSIADTSWGGTEDVPDGAIATVKQDVSVTGDKQIGREAEITVPDGVTLTVDGDLTVNGTLQINGTLDGSGTLIIGRGGKVEGDTFGVRVEYPADMEDAKNLIGNRSYTAAQATAVDAAAVKNWLAGEIAALPDLSATGVVIGEITVTSFTPATAGNAGKPNGTNGSFAFTVALSKGSGTGQAAGTGSITATAYAPLPVTTYTVIFDPAGGTRTGGGELTQIVSEGASAAAPIVTRSSYTFTGWDKDFSRITADLNVTAQWNKNSTTGGGSSGGSSYTEPEPQSSYTVVGDNISRSVSRSDLKKLADSNKSLTLSCDKSSMTFDPAALKAILAAVPATVGNITFAAAPADPRAFPDAAKQLGAHPVYDFTIRYKDGNGNLVTVPVNFPAGSAAITLTYAPAAAEVTGSLFMVYVDGKGAVTWLDKSSYDNGKVLADAPHFSTYGVAYKAPVPVFTDISGHWAKQDIEFVAARGLLSGTGNNQFSPDGIMTRGMFVTALGRLAGVNPDSYQSRSFTDVKADAYYAAYVEWAAQKNIVKGTGDKLFSPDAPVTREQMAVLMVNYAGQMGYSIPTPLAAVTFADNDKISAWAAKEVAAMQRAGIVKGKDGNRFDPQASATRAEISVVLRRFVEIVIDPATATGWVKNDSGHWLYYKGGTALTDWQTIGKLRYFFNADGVMHEGWKQDESTGKWYYWTNAGAATGWREIEGKWYYFDENGVMAVNTKIDGYEIGPDGVRKEN
ncbi:S-layer homology domain-containing protein [Clostridium sp. AM58-1XD]|uniref:S-layer homology domain-containing protein n=1 Tax=Clostridium sp. AM58-1XD TaxID=2292307 RepID=UPI00241D4203|nr:S-layer homology domain-containing protein [Clostridium sp. AM58-1XD]